MQRNRTIILLVAGLLLAAALWGQVSNRIRALQEKLIAPCCWSESVAMHRSEVAAEMRAEIARMVNEGRSDSEILDFYKAKYGKRILMEPEGELRVWAYTIPIAAAVVGLGLVVWLIRRMVRPQPENSESGAGAVS
ncbi:MAG: cytochrome c-type biogenesis protein [Acidobacteriota bacterium]